MSGRCNGSHSPAISLVVSCQTPAGLDTFWTRLSTGGQEVRCGWLKDRYGVSTSLP